VTTSRRLSALSVTTFSNLALFVVVVIFAGLSQLALAQQTLGAMNGTVTDTRGPLSRT